MDKFFSLFSFLKFIVRILHKEMTEKISVYLESDDWPKLDEHSIYMKQKFGNFLFIQYPKHANWIQESIEEIDKKKLKITLPIYPNYCINRIFCAHFLNRNINVFVYWNVHKNARHRVYRNTLDHVSYIRWP